MRDKRGQSLVEILLAGVVGSIMVAAAVLLITPSLKGTKQANKIQIAANLGRQLLENVRIWSESDWQNISGLAAGSGNLYHLEAAGNTFTVSSSWETISYGNENFTRAFYLDGVLRNQNDDSINPAGILDPSTKKITVLYSWPGGSTNSFSEYLARSKNQVFVQNDWSGGAGSSNPVSNTTNRFDSAVNADATGTGSIIIKLY